MLFDEHDPLVLESGEPLAPVEVAYETYGELERGRLERVFVCHALTGDAHAAGHHGDPARPGWWDNLIGPGKPIDTDRLFVDLREPARRLPGHDRARARSTRAPASRTGCASRSARCATS